MSASLHQEIGRPRIEANVAALARKKASGIYSKHPEWEELDVRMMERDNERAIAEAGKAIEAERKVRKCYICDRQDLPRMAWIFALVAAGAGLLWWRGLMSPEAAIPIVALLAAGAAFGAGLHEASDRGRK